MLLRSVARPHSVISINRLFRSVRGSSLPFPEIGATFFAKRPSFPPPRAAAHQRVGTDDNMKYTEMKFPRLEEVVKAYEFRQVRHLYLRRLPALRAPAKFIHPNDHVILPDVISKEPLAPVVRQRDDDWKQLTRFQQIKLISPRFAATLVICPRRKLSSSSAIWWYWSLRRRDHPSIAQTS